MCSARHETGLAGTHIVLPLVEALDVLVAPTVVEAVELGARLEAMAEGVGVEMGVRENVEVAVGRALDVSSGADRASLLSPRLDLAQTPVRRRVPKSRASPSPTTRTRRAWRGSQSLLRRSGRWPCSVRIFVSVRKAERAGKEL